MRILPGTDFFHNNFHDVESLLMLEDPDEPSNQASRLNFFAIIIFYADLTVTQSLYSKFHAQLSSTSLVQIGMLRMDQTLIARKTSAIRSGSHLIDVWSMTSETKPVG